MKLTYALLLLAAAAAACSTKNDEDVTTADAATVDAAKADLAPPPTDLPSAVDVLADLAPPQAPVEDYACATDSDCCVIYASCEDTLVLVTDKNRERARATYAAMKPAVADPKTCWPCVPPAVEVSCVAGRCRAEPVTISGLDQHGLSSPHCGSRLASDAGVTTTRASLAAPAAGDPPEPRTAFSCH
jgi:hypothetical protein